MSRATMMTGQRLELPPQLTTQLSAVPQVVAQELLQQVIFVQVNPGETFTIRTEDGSLQCIQGPAEVPMMSLNGSVPPIHVPPGYVSQVLEDSVGVRRVVVLPHSECYPNYTVSISPMHPLHLYGGSPHILPAIQPSLPLPPGTHQFLHHQLFPLYVEDAFPFYTTSAYIAWEDQSAKLHPKVKGQQLDRQCQLGSPSSSLYKSHVATPSGYSKTHTCTGRSIKKAEQQDQGSPQASEPRPQDHDLETESVQDMLPGITKPQVSNIQSHSVQLSWAPCLRLGLKNELDNRPCTYEVMLSAKGSDGKYSTVYSGERCECVLNNLRPASHYHVRLSTVYRGVRGCSSELLAFKTLGSAPDCPVAPRLSHHTKTSLTLCWKPPVDNGSKIIQYHLEWNEGKKNGTFRECYSGSQQHCKLSRLCPFVGYRFRVAAQNDNGISDFSPEVEFYTTGSHLQLPQAPRLVSAGVTSVALEWSRPESLQPEEVVTYMLEAREEKSEAEFQPKYSGQHLTCTVDGLKGNTQYGFRLVASSSEGSSGPSTVLVCTTSSGPPSKPRLKGAIRPHSFTVTWDPPQDHSDLHLLAYLLQISDTDSEGGVWEVIYSGTATEHVCDDLSPGTHYRLRLSTLGKRGHSQHTESLPVRTMSVAPGPCLPPKIVGTPRAREVHLQWECPLLEGACVVTEYSLEMRLTDGEATKVYCGPGLDYTVTGLLPGTPYWFSVRAANEAGHGPFSEPTMVTTLAGPPGQCGAPLLTLTSDTCVFVSWQSPDGFTADVSEYHLEWSQSTESLDLIYTGIETQHKISNLTPGTQYYCRVQAANQTGTGPYSELSICCIPPAPPSAVPCFTSQDCDLISDPSISPSTCIALKWEEPRCNGTPIITYTIAVGDQLISVDNVTCYMIDGLQPNCEYSLSIRAVNEIGPGPWSPPLHARTRPLPPPPPQLECVAAGPQSLKLRWTDSTGHKTPSSETVTYALQMKDGDQRFVTIYWGPSHTFKVQRLTEYKSYSFRIQALSEAGEGRFSDTCTFSTTRSLPPAMKAPKVVRLYGSSCQITWEEILPMTGDSISYLLQALVGRESEYRQVFKGQETMFCMTGLSAKAEYRFRVCACRYCVGTGQELFGPFSPPCLLQLQQTGTCSVPPSGSQCRAHSWIFTDDQFAAVIVAGLAALSVLAAFVLQLLFMK